MEENQKNAMSSAQFFNNYVGWWQDLQESYSKGTWQYFVSSDFRRQFPNATFNTVTEGNLVVDGVSSGHWSPTRGRISAKYGTPTTTIEGKFTYHCPGEIEMSSYYIPTINLNSGFWDPSLETRELDNTLSAGEIVFAAGAGISQSQINSASKALQKSGKGSLPYFTKGGKFLGWISAGTDFIDFAGQPTWGNGVKVGLDVATIYVPYAGWTYGLVDLSFSAFTNASLTDRIGLGIDSFLNSNGGIMIPWGNGYAWISNYGRK